MRHLTYLAVLAFCLACTAPLAVWLRRQVFGDVRRLGLTLLAPFVVFTGWDLYAVHAGHWSYDRDLTTGILLPGQLPLEEALFFVVVPLCMVLTFEAVDTLLHRASRARAISAAGRPDHSLGGGSR